ncbi:zinc finger protein OZF-like isoform X2 [Bradysia coprophila]|uniref:zinc finger protein OZF-like isoform X2 n=1 Tax=Bradysia coprophila TaxID=38358 RepID=UPI00187DAD50|nr:zinc finger protein OZF-like isoform X2 [Bradysia coprophila]
MSSKMFCRACGKQMNIDCQGIYLFGRNTNILEIFTKCTSLKIDQTDNLPEYLCDKCGSNLDRFYEFIINCEKTDIFFRQRLASQEFSHCHEKGRVSVTSAQDIEISNVEAISTHDIEISSDSSVDCVTKPIVPGGKYVCVYCGKKFKRKEALDGHIREHQGLDPFECEQCGTTFQKLRSLILHTNARHNDNFQKIPCNYDGCDKAFTTKFGLNEHLNNIHLGVRKPRTPSQISYICELCGKTFKNRTLLKKHSYSHSGERPFACIYCAKTFTVKDKLKNHIMRHENIKNFECSHCGMRKVTKAELKIHMNSHTTGKLYPCPQCPAVFTRDGNAKRHFRIVHRGYKPYKCTTCEQAFSKKETLKHHEMTHSGEKPHACTFCDRRFIQLIALKKHLKVHNKHELVLAKSSPQITDNVST